MPISKLTSLPFPPPAVPPFSASGQGLVASVNQLIDTSVASLKSLPASPQTDTVYNVIGFYANTQLGGGRFIWSPTANKSTHNGVTVYAPEALQAWAGTQADIATLLNWVGVGSGVWVRVDLQGFVTPEMAGAVGGGADFRISLQSAINVASQYRLATLLTSSVYGIGSSGLTTGGKLYGLLIPSNSRILSFIDTKILALGNEEYDPIATDKDAETNSVNIALSGFHVDGDSFNRSANTGVNFALQRVTNLTIRDTYSLNSPSFGWRIQSCSNVKLSFADSFQLDGSETNADGMHFIDTSDVTGSNIRVITDSDDGFVIEAINGDVRNYTISNLYVKSKGRGVLLFVDETLTPTSRVFKNIKIDGIAEDCLSTAVSLTEGSFDGIDIDISSDNCRNGLTLKPGTSTDFGYLRSCKFNINTRNCTQQGMFAVVTTGLIDDNEINLNVYNPGDGFNGVQLAGSNWRGRVTCNYDPDGTKASPATAILMSASSSTLTIIADGGNNSVIMQGTADDNNITLGKITDGITTSLRIDAGALNNNFSGGRISGTITNNGGTSNVFNGVIGATFKGLVQVTPDGSGEFTFNHNVAGLPSFAVAQAITSLGIDVDIIARTPTTLSVRLRFSSTAGLVTSGTYSVAFSASL